MIFVECKPDFVLVSLFKRRKNIFHAGNKAEVIKSLLKNQGCIGVVDADPNSSAPSFIKKFHHVKEYTNSGIKVLIAKNNSKLIMLYPRLEGWILSAVKEAGMNIKNFGLPDDEITLHAVINNNLKKFKRLLEELKSKSNRLQYLKKEIDEV
ncbi:MAG: hypothetical protein ACP6IS_07810 [Candidatus Asgardarchaeia archaeon]